MAGQESEGFRAKAQRGLLALRHHARTFRRAVLHHAPLAWERLERALPTVGRLGRFIWEVVWKYHRDDCFTYAASLSFFLVISLLPLATLFFKVLALSVGQGIQGERLQVALDGFLPFLPHSFLKDAVRHANQVSGWGISTVVLLVGAHWGVNQLDRTLAHIFGLRIRTHRQTRSYHLVRRMGLVVGGLIFLALLMTVGFEWVFRAKAPFAFSNVLFYTFLPPMVGLALVTMVLQHLPRRHVPFRYAFTGALVCAGAWWLAKWLFGLYLAYTPTWGILFGSLGGMMAALVFLYYSSAIFLLGAEVTAALERRASRRRAM